MSDQHEMTRAESDDSRTSIESNVAMRTTGLKAASRKLKPEGSSQWSWGRRVAKMMGGTSKVPMVNKVGIVPEGDVLVVANALHRGLGPALLGEPSAFPEGTVTEVERELFAQVRKLLGISRAALHASLALQSGRTETDMSAIPVCHASGKSSSSYFLSPDQHFILKSAGRRDVSQLRKILPAYIEHLSSSPRSLLPRYVALVTLAMPGRKPQTFVVMSNALGGLRPIKVRFDLKGSSHGRFASAKERAKDHPVLKDRDFLDEGRTLLFEGQGTADDFIASLQRDISFLTAARLIDYSLLIGVHETASGERPCAPLVETTPGLVVIESDAAVTYVCLIDVLTAYGFRKRMETFFLGTLVCGRDISCQPPKKYARRFLRLIKQVTPADGTSPTAALSVASLSGRATGTQTV